MDRIADLWGERTPYAPGAEWPARVDEHYAEGVTPDVVQRWVPTASLLDSNGDAMDIAVVGGRIAGVRGRAGDRVHRGRVDIKDLFGWQANNSADRLTAPLIRDGDRLVETDWDTAMNAIVSRTRTLLDEHGPGSIGFYTTGQLFCEEYYTLTTIARAGIGTDHLDGNTRLCTSTAAEALKETFRQRRPAGVLLRRRPCRRDRAVRAQRRGDAAGVVDADAGPARRLEPAPAARGRPAPHCGRRARHGAPRAAARDEPRARQRVAPAAHRLRPRRQGVRPGTHGRLRGTRKSGRGLHPRVGLRDLRRAGR